MNNGDLTGTSQVGFYYGNKSYIASVESLSQFIAFGCVNNGILTATDAKGVAGICNGSDLLEEAYGDIDGTGACVSGSVLQDKAFQAFYHDGFLLVSEDASEEYTYQLVISINTIYWDDGYVANGTKIVLPTEYSTSAPESGIQLSNSTITVYDKQTAEEERIITADEEFTAQDPVSAYWYTVKEVDGHVYLVVDVGSNGTINSVIKQNITASTSA